MRLTAISEYAEAVCRQLLETKFFDNPTNAPDKWVKDAVKNAVCSLLRPGNQPTGRTIRATSIELRGARKASPESALQEVKELQASGSGSISIAFYGESHRNAADEARARHCLDSIRGGVIKPTLLVFERGMEYETRGIDATSITESALTVSRNAPGEYEANYRNDWGFALSAAQRSMVVAGYVLLCVANGNMTDEDRIVMFFGQNHEDILTFFEYYGGNHAAPWVQERKRTYLRIKSLAS